MGTVTKTIGSAGGRDYATIADWEAALPANLVTDGNAQVGECYNDSEFTSTSNIAIAGQTTDSTNFVTLTAASGQSFQDNANKLTNRLAYNQSNGVALAAITSTHFTLLTVNTARTVVKRIQIKNDRTASDGILIGTSSTIFQDLIIVHAVNGLFHNASGATTTATNVLCIQTTNAGSNSAGFRGEGGGGSALNLNNCCAVRYSNIGATTGGNLRAAYCTLTAKNTGGFGAASFNTNGGGGVFAGNNNASDKTISFGSSNQASLTYADQFEQPSNASSVPDFRTKSGANLVDNGATLTLATDIVGTARPQGSSWDIGVWELASGGGGGETVPFWPFRAMLGVGR